MNKLIFVLLLCPFLSFGQNWWNTDDSDSTHQHITAHEINQDTLIEVQPITQNDSVRIYQKGEVKIVKDERIERLLEFKTSVRQPNTAPMMEGYRVQVFFDQEREKIDEARKKLLTLNPDLATYIEYQAPNYLLLVGDFRSKIEAEKLQNELFTEFSEGIVVKTQIFLPKTVLEEKE